MKHIRIVAASVILTPLMAFTSCETPEGQGAVIGAAGGAALGGLLGGGRGSNIAAGAILGAGTGALVGHMVGKANEDGYYNGKRLPYGTRAGNHLVRSPYSPHNLIDVRGIPSGAVVEDPTTGRRFINP